MGRHKFIFVNALNCIGKRLFDDFDILLKSPHDNIYGDRFFVFVP